MPRLLYTRKNFRPETLRIIESANRLIDAYEQQGFDLTLRQAYYLFISRDLFPGSWIDPAYNRRFGLAPDTKNTDKNYKRLGSILNDARMAGLVDWTRIVDRTRNLRTTPSWDDPADMLDASTRWFHIDLWADQPTYVEVWIEKDALIGVIEPICRELDVPYFSCRGYTSQSEMWGAARRLLRRMVDGKNVRILHLGDHDPSGIDMSRDIEERLAHFLRYDFVREFADGLPTDEADRRAEIGAIVERAGEMFGLDRLALNMDQIQQYDPPPNPAKLSDARARGYIAEYGPDSWELDALEPTVLAGLIREAVEGYLDADLFDAAVEREQRHLAFLRRASRRWEEIESFLDGGGPSA